MAETSAHYEELKIKKEIEIIQLPIKSAEREFIFIRNNKK